jgi:hypothetical protein
MDTAYISDFAALAGSVIGAFASFATTWLTQHQQGRATRLAQEMSRRKRLYGEADFHFCPNPHPDQRNLKFGAAHVRQYQRNS